MSIIETIIKANQEGRKIVWPSAPKFEQCIRCNESYLVDTLDRYNYCEHCHDDMFTPWPTKGNKL